ncbi:MAG: hypothetical protein ABS43_22030 [Bordetella sp. SCN 67-23]|nr:MAG: hypothetical protein ABS43_22030 [Bordetella sp. SCN 67-23]
MGGLKQLAATLVVSAIGLVAGPSDGAAQPYPARTVRIVVPYGAGGGPDVTARVIAQKLSENIGHPVVVDNRPGAGGAIAAQIVATAPADGYTVFIVDTSHVAINPYLYPKLPYDPNKDFAAVLHAATTPLYLAVNAGLPVHSVKDLIDYARANPGVLYASSGNGSVHHLGMELFKSLTSVNMTHVPYRGVSQSVPALVGGEVSVLLGALPSLVQHVKTGKVRLLAVGTAKRSLSLPDVKTVAESGVPGFEVEPDMGFLVPAGTPGDVVAKLNAELQKALNVPEVAERLLGLGVEVIGSSPEQFSEWIRLKQPKYRKLVKESGARVD